MPHKLVKTEDGSHSLFVEELNEHYHSIHGAIQESKHVFIEAGLKSVAAAFKDTVSANIPINILEIGFGTGLNAFLTCMESSRLQVRVNYTGIEPFPLDRNLLNSLNYAILMKDGVNSTDDCKKIFDTIHSFDWNKQQFCSDYFSLRKINATIQQVDLKDSYELIYFDAFGPSVQPEMWIPEIFLDLYDILSANGVLVTYCAKGSVKRTLREIGFEVETLKGPPGKREMIRARKSR